MGHLHNTTWNTTTAVTTKRAVVNVGQRLNGLPHMTDSAHMFHIAAAHTANSEREEDLSHCLSIPFSVTTPSRSRDNRQMPPSRRHHVYHSKSSHNSIGDTSYSRPTFRRAIRAMLTPAQKWHARQHEAAATHAPHAHHRSLRHVVELNTTMRRCIDREEKAAHRRKMLRRIPQATLSDIQAYR